MRTKRIFILFLLCLSMMVAKETQARDRYVSVSGYDEPLSFAPCLDPSSPCRTIQWAVNCSSDGDRIKVAEGVYEERIGIQEPITGLVIEGGWNIDFSKLTKDPSKTTISYDGAIGGGAFMVFAENQEEITVSITNLTIRSQGVQINAELGKATANFEGNIIQGGGISAIANSGGETSINLRNNGIYGSGITANSNVWCTVNVNLKDNNIISPYSQAIQMTTYYSQAHLNAINNIIYSKYHYAIFISAYDSGQFYIDITNNTIIEEDKDVDVVQVYLEERSYIEMTIYNSIVWNLGDGISEPRAIDINRDCPVDPNLRPTGSVSVHYSNIGGTIESTPCVSAFTLNESNNINDAPGLNDNFHLKSGSPCKNKGKCGHYYSDSYVRIAPYTDIDGDDRPGDGTVLGCDIGADEFALRCMPWTYLLTD